MPEVALQAQVVEALEDCQKSFATHKRCMLRMKQAQQSDPTKFKQTLFSCLNRAMLVFRREPAVERMLHFIASFVSFSNEKYQTDGELAVELLERMIPLTAAKDKAVRFRSCQLTSKLLNRSVSVTRRNSRETVRVQPAAFAVGLVFSAGLRPGTCFADWLIWFASALERMPRCQRNCSRTFSKPCLQG